MSAYVVDDQTINKVISFLSLKQSGGNAYWPKHSTTKTLGTNLIETSDCEALAQKMFNLNVDAVNQRYGDGNAEQFRPLDFQYRFRIGTSATQAYKLLGCWLYQCSEGNVPETSDLYKAMSEIHNKIAHFIIQTSSAYENAEWG